MHLQLQYNYISYASHEAQRLDKKSVSTVTSFLLTRLSRGATLLSSVFSIFPIVISTHTPLARRNDVILGTFPDTTISTHTPLARRNYDSIVCTVYVGKFLLTRLSRGATQFGAKSKGKTLISTHTPLARRNFFFCFKLRSIIFISTHTPLARRNLTNYQLLHRS